MVRKTKTGTPEEAMLGLISKGAKGREGVGASQVEGSAYAMTL